MVPMEVLRFFTILGGFFQKIFPSKRETDVFFPSNEWDLITTRWDGPDLLIFKKGPFWEDITNKTQDRYIDNPLKMNECQNVTSKRDHLSKPIRSMGTIVYLPTFKVDLYQFIVSKYIYFRPVPSDHPTALRLVSNEKNPGCLGCIGDEIHPMIWGFYFCQYKDPYKPTRIQWKVRPGFLS